MKKSDILLVGAIVVIVMVAIFSSRGNKVLEDIEFPLTLAGDAGLHQITYNKYDSMVKNGDAFIVVLKREGCAFCTQYMPIVEDVANEKKVSLYYIDTGTLTEEEYNLLNTTNSYLKRNKWGTPTTLFMLGDRVVDAISGYVDKEDLLSFLDGRIVMGE